MNARIKRSGFSLVEVVLAIFVLAVGALTVFSLFPEGLKLARNSTWQNHAANIANYIYMDLYQEGHTNFAGIVSANYVYENGVADFSVKNGETNAVRILNSDAITTNNDCRIYLDVSTNNSMSTFMCDVLIRVYPGLHGSNHYYQFAAQIANYQ